MWVDTCPATPAADTGGRGSAVRVTGVLAVLAAVALLLSGDLTNRVRQEPADGWLVESVHFQGRRGGPGTYWVTCTHPALPDRWREVAVSAAVADSVEDGGPCPAAGSVRHG